MTVDRMDDAPSGPSPIEVMQDEMRPGERLVWADRPDPGRLAVSALPMSFFGLFFFGFAVFWMVGAWQTMDGSESGFFVLFPLFGLPFLLVGLGIVLAPLWVYMHAHKTVYAITSQRLIIKKGRTVKTYEPEEIEKVERTDHKNGLGDVIFARELHRTRGRHGSRTRIRKVGFLGVLNARQVEDAVRKLKDSAGN